MEMFCPKCKVNTEFYEIDDGPDVEDTSISYISYNCEICNSHLDGNNKNWYDGNEVVCYLQLEYAKPFMTSSEYEKILNK